MIDSVMGYMIEWGTIPEWVTAVVAAGFGVGWPIWRYLKHREGKQLLIITHEINAVPGSDGYYTLMVNMVVNNPSRVRVIPKGYYITIWDIQQANSPKKIPGTGIRQLLNQENTDLVLEPGATVPVPFPIQMPDSYNVLKIKTAIPHTKDPELEWGRTDVFEFHAGERRRQDDKGKGHSQKAGDPRAGT